MLALLLLTAAAVEPWTPWAHFSRTPFLRGVHERVEIGSGKRLAVSSFRYVLKLTTQERGKETTLWADSDSCAAVRPIMVGMSKLSMPQPAPYGVPGDTGNIVVDGTEYELNAPSSYSMGELALRSNVGSPLSTWVDGALARLDACWSSKQPR